MSYILVCDSVAVMCDCLAGVVSMQLTISVVKMLRLWIGLNKFNYGVKALNIIDSQMVPQ